MTQSSAKQSSNTGNSSLALSEERFHGVLDIEKKRLFRKYGFDFISYIYSQYTPPNFYLQIISVWRCIQIFVPGIFASNTTLYPKGELLRSIVAFFSFFNRIVPSSFDGEYFIPFTGVYLCIYLVIFVLIIILSSILQKSGKIHRGFCIILVLFFEGLCPLLLPIMFAQAGDQVGLILIQKEDTSNAAVWVLLVLLIFVNILILFLHTIFLSASLTFRPTSLASFYFNVDFQIMTLTSVIGFLGSISPYCPKTARIILYAVIILCAAGALPVNIGYYQIISSHMNSFLMSMVTLCIFSTLICMICDIIDKDIPAIFLLCDVIVLLIGFAIFHIIRKKRLLSAQFRLDDFEVDSESFNTMKVSPFQALEWGINGFSLGHQFVLSWDYFRLLVARWPKYVPAWIIWARFCSAFPEETGTLLWIDGNIRRLKIHRNYASHIRAQIIYLARQREDSMTHVLKRKISRAIHEVQFSKNRLRHFWECVIQGSVVDMESAAISAQMSTKNAEFDMLHLLHSYPNNQYVARIYSRFLLNVKGDKLEYAIWRQNCDQLKNGQKIVPDQAQQEALHLFPNILSLTVQRQRLTVTTGLFGESTTSAPSLSSSSIPNDDENEDHSLLLNSVRDSIRRMKIPAIQCLRISLIVFIIIFLVFWLPFLYAFYYFKVQGTFDVIEMSINSAFTRNALSFLMVLSLFKTASYLGMFDPAEIQKLIMYNESLPHLGNNIDSSHQMSFLMTAANDWLDELRKIADYDLDSNQHLSEAQRAIFESRYTVSEIVSYDPSTQNIEKQDKVRSGESAILYLLMNVRKIIEMHSTQEILAMLQSSLLPNMYVNFLAATEGLDEFCHQMTEHTLSLVNNLNDTLFIMSIVGYAIAAIYTIAMMIYAFIEIRKQKRIIIRAFMTIPKHVISKIVDTLKINAEQEIEAETSNDETGEITRNKQEENFLALLGTTSSSSSALFNAITIIIISIFLIGLGSCLNVFDGVYHIKNSANKILYAAPDADYFLGTVTEFAKGALENYRLVLFDQGFPFIGDTDRDIIIKTGKDHIQNANNYFHYVRYGNETYGLHELNELSSELVSTLCLQSNVEQIGQTSDTHDAYAALSSDSLIVLYSVMLPRLFELAEVGPIQANTDMIYLIEMMAVHIYNNFYFDNTSSIPQIARDEFYDKLTFSLLYTFLIYIATVIFIIICFVMLTRVNMNLKWMTEVLLQCPPKVLMNSKQIVRLITGHFKEKKKTVRNDNSGAYYDELVEKFIDSVIFVSTDFTIISANPATARVIGIQPEEVIGKHLNQLLKYRPSENDDGSKDENDNNKNDNSIEKLFKQIEEALKGRKSFNFGINVETVKPDGSTVFLNITVNAISKKGVIQDIIDAATKGTTLKCLIIVARDISQSVLSKRLLKEERMRSDTLLRHILPSVVVDALQRGETDVSFSVSSATIVFMDIVSFTPWCASNTAQVVMSTLNRLFKEFDWILSFHPSLTKMKCIGDCYVAAGGLFDDPNVPEVHAEQMTHFGCLATKAVTKINAEINQSLRIRVGINTGGPIAAGVLGVDRPTFEIFGPAINMAQQMEHHGVPMMVHVSRSVYELIYSADFEIKERGEIEVKNSMITTYLVDPENIAYPEGGP